MKHDLTRRDLEELHSVMRRFLERAEKRKDTEHAEKLAREIANLDFELRQGVR